MRYKLILLILTMSIMLSGCMDMGTKNNTDQLVPGKMVNAHYIDKHTILNREDFPGFKQVNNVYYVAPENLSLTLETAMGHGILEMNESADVLPGYRIYGSSEAYNLSENSKERYILVQYQVFDTNESLDDTISMTAEDIYVKHGYKHVPMNNTHNGNVVILESNITNNTDMNVTIILFGFDTVIGKIGVQDFKDKSLSESLKILDIVFNRINVKTKEVKAAKLNLIRLTTNMTNRSHMSRGSNMSDASNISSRSNT
jgi:hypothetical protein